jgi:hypothetical protein
VEELIGLMNTRDRRPTHLCHPDIEWHWSQSTPGASLYRGHAELDEGLDARVESWDELVIEPQEILDEGDWVFVMTEYRSAQALVDVRRRGEGAPPFPGGRPPRLDPGRWAVLVADIATTTAHLAQVTRSVRSFG